MSLIGRFACMNGKTKLAFVFGTVLALTLLADFAEAKFSEQGREFEVEFENVYRFDGTSVEELQSLSEQEQKSLVQAEVLPLMDFAFGPLTHHNLGAPQRIKEVEMKWNLARVVGSQVEVPYTYRGIWLVATRLTAQGAFELPLPINSKAVYSANWKRCTDSEPDHQTRSFYWYFWDPSRFGCDHKEGVHYNSVVVKLKKETANHPETRPEYDRMLLDGAMTMTIAFGYVADPSSPNPGSNWNQGMGEYRSFLRSFAQQYGAGLKVSPIYQKEYRYAQNPNLVIGQRFEGVIRGVKVRVNVVTSAGVDQMELFAKSFAHDHDDVFAWFGHSRVGSGFDAERFAMMLQDEPEYYKLTNNYQVIYWGGCNSYSYYTLPFFQLKADVSMGADPEGIRNLDIISNGLPSYFNLNAANAMITAKYFLNWEKGGTYQAMVADIERAAERMGTNVLAIVMGDEDNDELDY